MEGIAANKNGPAQVARTEANRILLFESEKNLKMTKRTTAKGRKGQGLVPLIQELLPRCKTREIRKIVNGTRGLVCASKIRFQ